MPPWKLMSRTVDGTKKHFFNPLNETDIQGGRLTFACCHIEHGGSMRSQGHLMAEE